MEQQVKPHVDVTITPELYALYAGRKISGNDVNAIQTRQQKLPHETKSCDTKLRSGWVSYTLRRDGKRPLKFEGLKIASYTVPIPLKQMVFEYQTSIYIDRSKDIYMSLILLLPPDAAARSIFDAGLISTQAPRLQLSDWCDKVSEIAKRVTSSSLHTDTLLQIRNAIRPKTPLCL